MHLQSFKYFIVSCIFGRLVCWKTCAKRVEIGAFFLTVKPPHVPQPTIFGLVGLYVYPTVSIAMDLCVWFFFFSPALLCSFKMASTWLSHHRKAANHPACASMFSHVWRALVRIPMWGRVSLAARLILASFLLCGKFGERLSGAGGLHAGLMVTKSHQ